MHPFVKILIVVNLLFAVGFWAYSAAALEITTNYKQQVEETKTAAATAEAALQADLSSARADLQAARDSRSTADQRADEEKARADRLQADLAAAQRENAELNDSFKKVSNSLDDINATIASVSSAKEAAETARREAEQARDAAAASQRTAEQARRAAQEELASAQRTIADLESELTVAKETLSATETQLTTLAHITNTSLSDVVAQPLIEGAVVALDPGLGLVILNRGSTHGVKVGNTFEVHAGGVYKGQVRVVNVFDDKASATVERKGNAPIAQGDRASTRL
ncbi:MAG: hypothetical protein GC161_10365 [Planctomycetaceae bacterium]|nr:hypothetical protein [Planctomycetaceae bacterium]